MNERRKHPKQAIAWATYDWANSAFATTVVAGFFPALFKDYWAAELSATDSTFWLGVTLTVGASVVALSAPTLGRLADQNGTKKTLLAVSGCLGILSTAALGWIERGAWQLALGVYLLAYVGWLGSIVFYDALLPAVSDARTVDRVSSLGFALGYLGGGVLFGLDVLWFMAPEAFGFASKAIAARASFLSVAVWWFVFSMPLLFFVREPVGDHRKTTPDGSAGLHSLVASFERVRQTPNALRFLVAYWLYIDAVDTVVTMAIDFGRAIGIGTGDLVAALLLVQFVAFPFAWAFGYASRRFGPKRLVLVGLAVYVAITVFGSQLRKEPLVVVAGVPISGFFVLAFLVGAVQGGVQALSRSLFARLVPKGHEGELFGFYNMVGKFAAIVGPVLVGTVGRLTHSSRLGILSLVVLFAAGAVLLYRVPIGGPAPRPTR